MYRSRRLFTALVLCGLPSMTAMAQTVSPPSQALLEDAASYASDTGVSVDEAVRRLRLQNEVGRLDEMLSTQEADSYAGLWIEHEPKFKVVVRFQNPAAEGRLRGRVAGTPLEGLVETRPAAVSLAKLEERRAVALQRARGARFAVDSDINVKENRVEIYSDRAQSLRAALAAERATLPERVEIIAVPSLAQPAVLRGGDGDPGFCTGGFTVRTTDSTALGISTAGHCDNFEQFQGLTLPFQEEFWYSSGDVQWHSACGIIDVSNEFNSGLGHRACTGTRLRSQQAIGTYVCKWGRVSGRTCGYIQSKSVQPSYVPGDGNTFIRVDGRGWTLSVSGDSGGPWFVENIAYGISSGRYTDGDAIYMPIDYFSWVGVAVLTYNPGPGCGAPPVASFYYSASSTWVDFNASGSYDPDGSIVSYSWDFGDGTTGSGATVSHLFPYEGNFLVTLTVTDNAGKTGQYAQYVYAGQDPCGGDPCCGTYCCGNPYCLEP